MNKLKLLLFMIIFLPFSVSAACSTQDLSRYKTLAGHINNYYTFNGSTFDVTLYNVSNELRVVDKTNNKTYYSDSNIGNLVVNNLSQGSIINFAVYPINGECSDYRVLTVYVNLPYFNSYYNDPVCNNNSSNLCSKWVNTSFYTYDEFVNRVAKKKKEEFVEEQKPEEEIRKYGFFDFLGDYYIPILLFIIITGSIGIYYLDKKSKFDF